MPVPRRSLRPVPTFLLLLLSLTATSCGTSPQFGPANGALVIVGGGRVNEDIWGPFLELAGGAAEARLIVVPTAGGREEYDEEQVVAGWQARGVEHVKMLHTVDPAEADTEEFVTDLREATAVWFNGGRQWRLT
ncbi:peptidase S51, partial [Gemmatimonadota bacterium]